MTIENIQQQMTDEDRAKFERGAELLKHLQAGKGFDDYWVPIGAGLMAVRRTVMNALRLKKARGGLYNDMFGKLVARTAYVDMHKVERSNLLYCMEHLDDITEMRVKWTPSDRAKVIHPTSMAQRLREFLNRAPEEKPKRNVSPMALLKDKAERLERANLDLAEKVASFESVQGSAFDIHKSNADEIAEAIVGELHTRKDGRQKAKKIAEGILVKLKRLPSRPAG